MKHKGLITAILAGILVVGACDSGNTPPPRLTPTPTSTAAATTQPPTPSAVAIVSPTATLPPGPTSTPTSTATATTQPPTPSAVAIVSSTATPPPGPTPAPTPTATATTQPLSTDTPAPDATPSPTPIPPALPPAASPTAAIGPVVPALDTVQTFDSVNVHAIAFSPDGTRFVLHTADHGLQVFDTQTWSLLWQVQPEPVLSVVQVSPDGQRLSSLAGDRLQVWDIHTGRELAAVTMAPQTGGQLDYNGDGFFLAATYGEPGKVAVVRATDGEPVGTYVNQWQIFDQTLAPDGPWLAVVTGGSWGPLELAVWDIFTHERRTLASCACLPSFSNAAFSPDTEWLAAWTKDGPVHVWKPGPWSEIAPLEIPFDWVYRVEFSGDGHRLAAMGRSQGPSSYVRVWDVPGWQHRFDIDLGDAGWDLAFSPDGRWLATAHGQGDPPDMSPLDEGRLWRVDTGALEARMPHDGQVRIVAFDPLGRWVATAGAGARVWALPQ